MAKPMQHLNGSRLVSIDVETTGTVPGFHEIMQIALIPLNGFLEIDKDILPFDMGIMPRKKENIDPKAMHIHGKKITDLCLRGNDSDRVIDLLIEWIENLKMPPDKRIMPLGCNWPFDSAFIRDWLGPATYDLYFDARYRDVMAAGSFANDCADWQVENYPYPKLSISYLCTHLKIQRTQRHDALDDARVTAEIYKRMVMGVV